MVYYIRHFTLSELNGKGLASLDALLVISMKLSSQALVALRKRVHGRVYCRFLQSVRLCWRASGHQAFGQLPRRPSRTIPNIFLSECQDVHAKFPALSCSIKHARTVDLRTILIAVF